MPWSSADCARLPFPPCRAAPQLSITVAAEAFSAETACEFGAHSSAECFSGQVQSPSAQRYESFPADPALSVPVL